MNKPKVFAHCSYIGPTGYAQHTRSFFRALSNLTDVKIRNFTVQPEGWKGFKVCHEEEDYLDNHDRKLLNFQTLFTTKPNRNDHPIYEDFPNEFQHDINIILAETNHYYFYDQYSGPKIAYNVWESTRQPENFFNSLKTYDQVWVASEWQRQCTIEQGIEANKVKVIPEAVDGNLFKPLLHKDKLEEYNDGRFKFLVFGRWDYRKSTKEVIETFLKTFDKDEPVDLVVSIDNRYANDNFNSTEERLKYYNLEDPRIKIKHFPTREEYINYLQTGHVFLSCARSEGWNLPLIEAMACGTPSIYSNCSGQLEFAKDKGLPVNIKAMSSAKMGEYSTFSQSDLPGEFYEPDFDHLSEIMRDAYTNYKTHKERALLESKEIRKTFTWENAAKKAMNEVSKLMHQPNKIKINFNEGPKVEVVGVKKEEYFVEFINANTNKVLHSSTINVNMWTRCNFKYYIPWIIKINGQVVHRLDLKEKQIKISFDSKSVGDTLAWMPQAVRFAKKHNCSVTVSTFHNEWFKGFKEYKDIAFIKPGEGGEFYAHYTLGWFRDENGGWKEFNKYPNQVNTIPLIQTATDILGLDYKEVNYGVKFSKKSRPIKEKYICIGPRSTAGLKEWPHQYWRELAKKLHAKGYKVVNLSYEGFQGANIINKKGLNWDDTFNYLYHAELFIGLGSGLSWANWALNQQTLMINNFIPYGYEFTKNLTKVENSNVCNNCWTNKDFVFDAGDWDWCPVHQNTDKQHICHKSIPVDQVFDNALNLLSRDKFVWITGGNEFYLGMIKVLAESLLQYSEHKLIVYGFNCEPNINLPNVINRRIDFPNKIQHPSGDEPDQINKDYSLYFGKFLASIESLKEEYTKFAWLDGDAFVTEKIDNSILLSNDINHYPKFMTYFHPDINFWREYKNIKLTSKYGRELAGIKNIKPNPYNKILATGFYFYDNSCKEFFEKCLEWDKGLNNLSVKVWVDNNAFSEERVANNIFWEDKINVNLPITWNNYYSPEEDIKLDNKYIPYLKEGFDVMFNKFTNDVYFIHGPDPSVKTKGEKILNRAYKQYSTTKLMIVAHPDDELIFGGGELIKHGSEYKVICLTCGYDDIRKSEFKEVMENLNIIDYEIWDYPDTLKFGTEWDITQFSNLINSKKWEKIVTHNSIGEYGHPQHKEVFDIVKSITDDFYVFGKSPKKLPTDILNTKQNLLSLYKSEQPIISQLLEKNGDWFKSNNDSTNYIEYESIKKYSTKNDTTKFVACYEK